MLATTVGSAGRFATRPAPYAKEGKVINTESTFATVER
jgi:hypothetical protein